MLTRAFAPGLPFPDLRFLFHGQHLSVPLQNVPELRISDLENLQFERFHFPRSTANRFL